MSLKVQPLPPAHNPVSFEILDWAFLSTKVVQARPNPGNVDQVQLTYPDGYMSACPKAVFARDYRPVQSMTFADALFCVARRGIVRSPSLGFDLWAIRRGSSVALLYNKKDPNGRNKHTSVDVTALDVAWLLASDWCLVGGANGKAFDPMTKPLF